MMNENLWTAIIVVSKLKLGKLSWLQVEKLKTTPYLILLWSHPKIWHYVIYNHSENVPMKKLGPKNIYSYLI